MTWGSAIIDVRSVHARVYGASRCLMGQQEPPQTRRGRMDALPRWRPYCATWRSVVKQASASNRRRKHVGSRWRDGVSEIGHVTGAYPRLRDGGRFVLALL